MNEVTAGQANGEHFRKLSSSPAVQPLIALAVCAYAWWTQVDTYARRTHRTVAPGRAQLDRVIRLLQADTRRVREQLTSPSAPAIPLRQVAR